MKFKRRLFLCFMKRKINSGLGGHTRKMTSAEGEQFVFAVQSGGSLDRKRETMTRLAACKF
jgi:hypothetical protein